MNIKMVHHHAGLPTYDAGEEEPPPYPPPSLAANCPDETEVVNFCGRQTIHSFRLAVAIAVVNVLILCVGFVDLYRSDFRLYELVPVVVYGIAVLSLVTGLSLKKSYLLVPFIILQWLLFLLSLAVASRVGLSIFFPGSFGLYDKKDTSAVSFITDFLSSDVWIEVIVVIWSLFLAIFCASALWVLHKCYFYLGNIAGQKYYIHHDVTPATRSSSSEDLDDSSHV